VGNMALNIGVFTGHILGQETHIAKLNLVRQALFSAIYAY